MAFHAEGVWVVVDPSFVTIVGLAILLVTLSLLWWRVRDPASTRGRNGEQREMKDQESQTRTEVSLANVLLVEDLRRSGLEKLLRATGRQVPRQRKVSSVEEVEGLIEGGKLELIMMIV